MMKNFDRILNVVLGIAVLLFIADYFMRQDAPAPAPEPAIHAEEEGSDFDPVALNGAAPAAPAPVPTPQPAAVPFSSPVPVEMPKPMPSAAPSDTQLPGGYASLNWDQLDARVAATNDKPMLLVVFTSWCPYCKKLMPSIVEMAASGKERFEVVAISTDQNPMALKSYMDSLTPKPEFTVYNNGKPSDQSMLQGFMFRHKLNFNGAVPFMVWFDHGAPYTQFNGYVEKNVLTQVLDRIERERKENPNRT